MGSVVNLEEASAVPAVADDVTAGVGIRAARLLRRDRREERWVEAMPAGGARDLRGVRDSPGGKAGSGRVDGHSDRLSLSAARLTR